MHSLNRGISAKQLLIITFGSTIGSGWLFAPYYTAKYAGGYAPITWLVGAITMAFIMLCFIELAVLYSEPGSMTRFVRRTHGPLAGGLYGLFLWLGMLSIPPIETSAILQYGANVWPELGTNGPQGFSLSYLGMGVAMIILFLMVIVNILAIRWFAKVSNLLVLIKVTIPVLLVIVLLLTAFNVSNFTIGVGAPSPLFEDILKALPLGGVIFAYTGFSNALQLAGEVKDPKRALPFALLGTCVLTSLLYMALQISFIGAFSPAELQNGWGPVVMAAERGPFLVLIEQLHLNWFLPLIAIASCLSPFVAGLISLSGSARTLFALSDDNILPRSLMHIDQQGIPKRAVVVNFLVGLLLLLPLPGWNKLVGLLVSMIAFVYSIGPISMGTLRLTHQNLERPFRLRVPHFVAFAALLAANRIIFWSGAEAVYFITVLVLSFYTWLMVFKIEPNQRTQEFKSSWWLLFYALSLPLLAYFGNFGGNSLLNFREENILIAVLTIVIYLMALFCGKQRSR